jgi:HAD superfamily hydrolase (TIGR01509 family)
MRTGLTTLCLDAGNTLIGMDIEFLREMLASEGIPATAEAVARAEAAARPGLSRWIASGVSTEAATTFSVYLRETLAAIGHRGVDDATLLRLGTRLRGVNTRGLWSRVLPGIPAALQALRAAGFRLLVVSNADGTVESGLASLGLRDLVDLVVDSHVVGFEKPDPRIFAHALAAVGASPAEALHTGDLYAVDVVGARAAGLDAVLLDPYDDWVGVDCERVADVPALAVRLIA